MRNFVKIIGATGILLIALLQGLGAEEGQRKSITVTDALGRRVAVLSPAQRLVVTMGQVAEILCALGVGDKIVGVADHIGRHNVDLLSGLKGRPMLGKAALPSIEKIVELHPDLVIAYDVWMAEEALEGKLAPLGIPVARLSCYRVEALREEIPILGKVVGREKEAREYLHYLQSYLNEVQGRLQGLKKRVRLYGETFSRLTTYSRKGPAAKVFEWAGVVNIAADLPVPSPRVSNEWVVTENPEVIVKVATPTHVKMGYGTENLQAVVDFRNDLLRRPAWDQIEAIKNGKVYLISSEIWNGPRAVVGILYLAKWCYPDRFQDIDPEQVHRQWLRKWHHQELRGIYVYP